MEGDQAGGRAKAVAAAPELPAVADHRLEDARKFPGCVLMLGCEICGYRKGYDVWKITRRLFDRGDGGFMTPVADVARSFKVDCPDCGGRDWHTQLAYADQLHRKPT